MATSRSQVFLLTGVVFRIESITMASRDRCCVECMCETGEDPCIVCAAVTLKCTGSYECCAALSSREDASKTQTEVVNQSTLPLMEREMTGSMLETALGLRPLCARKSSGSCECCAALRSRKDASKTQTETEAVNQSTLPLMEREMTGSTFATAQAGLGIRPHGARKSTAQNIGEMKEPSIQTLLKITVRMHKLFGELMTLMKQVADYEEPRARETRESEALPPSHIEKLQEASDKVPKYFQIKAESTALLRKVIECTESLQKADKSAAQTSVEIKKPLAAHPPQTEAVAADLGVAKESRLKEAESARAIEIPKYPLDSCRGADCRSMTRGDDWRESMLKEMEEAMKEHPIPPRPEVEISIDEDYVIIE